MRLVARIAAILVVLVVLFFAVSIPLVYFNQHRLIVAVLKNIMQQTGVEIVSASGTIKLRDHLIVVLDHPRVMSGNHEIVAMDQVTAIVNFHALAFSHGLPLRELDLDAPALTAPYNASAVGSGRIPRPDRALIDEALARLSDLAQVSRRVIVSNLKLRDQAGTPLLRDANLVAYHRRATPNLWKVGFEADCEFPKLIGTHVAGDFDLGEGGTLPPTQALRGTLWFWKLPLEHLSIGNLEVAGRSHGQIKISVAQDATIEGAAVIGLKALTVASPDLSSPLDLGAYTLEARFSTSTEKVTISNATLTQQGKPLAAAQVYVDKLYEQNPLVGINLAGVRFSWNEMLNRIRALKRMPHELELIVQHMRSGRIQVEKASLDAPLSTLENLTLQTILKKLSVTATLTEVGFALPPDTHLPDVAGASIQIVFSKQILSAVQGVAKLGNSELHDIGARLDLGKGLDEAPYQLSMKADLDLAELKPATVKMLDLLEVHERDRLQTVQGAAHVDLEASGLLRKNRPTQTEKYLITVEPHNIVVGFRGAPGPIEIASGEITAEPDLIRLHRVSARATGGNADFDGELRIGSAGIKTQGLKIALHQMPIERWLGGLVDPDDFSAEGKVGGEVVITGDRQSGFLANGKFTLIEGKIQGGFLRSPILVHPAVVTIRDHTMTVSMPAAELEKSPIDFIITVADIRKPSVQIDSRVQKFDIEVLKFVRLPWLPPTPTHPPSIPIFGHVEAREAVLETLMMKNGKTDFKYVHGDWSVDNLTATSLEGHLNIDIVGRQKDDWIRILGKAQNVNAAALFLLNKKSGSSPISGRLDVTEDLWADTNSDFFATLAGTTLLKLRDGTFNKFTLVSRLLQFIDLRSWLTAKVPDPRVSGIPFRTVTADFKGSEGVFYTDDLVLDGPAIDIVAAGNVNVAQTTLDMKIGMIPFNTVNWLLSGIPLVGNNVAGGTKSIISAYFNVRGPISNPSVTPAPISTVAELLKKTLGLPVNLIKPDTIK